MGCFCRLPGSPLGRRLPLCKPRAYLVPMRVFHFCEATFLLTRNILVALPTLMSPVASLAQTCDTARVNQEVRMADALVWSDYPKVLAGSTELVEKYKGTGPWCEGRTMQLLGKVMWSNGDYEQSVNLLRVAAGMSRKAGDTRNLAACDILIANNFYYQAYYDSAEKHFKAAIATYESAGMQGPLARSLHELALMYHRKGDIANALRFLYRSEELLGIRPDILHHVVDFTGTSFIFNDTLYYRTKVRDELRQLKAYITIGNQEGTFSTFHNLGRAYAELGDHLRSARYYAKGAETQSAIGVYPFWYAVGREYGLAGLKDSCFYFHYRSKMEFPRSTAIKVLTTYEELGDSHTVFNQLDSAAWYYEKALAMNITMNNRITIPNIQCKLAQVYHRKGENDKAERLLLQGLIQAKNVSMKYLLNLFRFGTEFYDATGQPGRALTYAKRVQSLSDSINRNDAALGLIHFQAQFETARKEKELAEAKLIVRNRTIILTSLAGFSLLLVAWGSSLYIQRRKIKRQNVMLEASNAEQRALTQEVHHRVKNNLQYIVSLLNLQAQATNTQELSATIEEIKNRIMTMGLIHQRLYKAQGLQRIDVAPFVQELVTNLLNALPSRRAVENHIAVEPLQVDIDTAISLGLLINEFITNAVKHAFHNHSSPEIFLSLSKEGKELRMKIRDNGPGFQFPGNGQGFGMKLIGLLVRKLKGKVHQPNANTIEISMQAAN